MPLWWRFNRWGLLWWFSVLIASAPPTPGQRSCETAIAVLGAGGRLGSNQNGAIRGGVISGWQGRCRGGRRRHGRRWQVRELQTGVGGRGGHVGRRRFRRVEKGDQGHGREDGLDGGVRSGFDGGLGFGYDCGAVLRSVLGGAGSHLSALERAHLFGRLGAGLGVGVPLRLTRLAIPSEGVRGGETLG
jgi:hypothetical protein